MNITLSYNNQLISCPAEITVAELVASQANPKQSFAVAVNGRFVARSSYANHRLRAGDTIDVVSAVTGG